MTIIDGLLIFFTIILIYLFIVIFLHKRGILEKHNISLYGPALLIRTKRGLNFLKRVASKKRFWKSYGSFGIVFCFIVMIFFITIFIWNVWMLYGLELTPEQKASLPGPEFALALPGINPILPIEYIGYIILALIIAIIVHEFSHGILSLAGKLKVKSLGILYMIVPLGAFTEPDEEELKKTETSKRMRVFAVGPLSNFVVAFIALLIFSFVFMSAIQPLDGAEVMFAYENTPAEEINIPSGARIINFNDEEIKDIYRFSEAIDKTSPNQTVNITYMIKGQTINKNVKLTSLYNFYDQFTDEPINESFMNMSFLGVRFTPQDSFTSSLKNPFTYDFPNGTLILYSLPILGYLNGYNPIASPFKENYKITGPLNILPTNIFWAIVTALYWIFWLNLAVGIFNVLPIVPLDGGFLFRDAVNSSIKRLKKDIPDEKREKIVKNILLLVSFTVLFLVLFPVLFKYI